MQLQQDICKNILKYFAKCILIKKITLINKFKKNQNKIYNYVIFKISRCSCVVQSSLNRTVKELSLYVLQ